MSGKSPLKFLIPESSCQQDFAIFALFADGTKDKVLRCDWIDKYFCDSAPGYTHTIENDTALITVPRDLKKEPEVFICEPYFQLKSDTTRCFCKMHVPEFIPGQPGGLSPGQLALIASINVILGLLLLVMVGCLINKYHRRGTSSGSQHDPNERPDECEPLKHQNSHLNSPNPLTPPPTASSTLNKETAETSIQTSPAVEETSEAKKDAPKISATDSEKSSTATVICFSCGAVHSTAILICLSCGTVQPIKETIPQTSEPSVDVPQISAADLQESSTPAVTAPPTETVPPKKVMIGRIKPHP